MIPLKELPILGGIIDAMLTYFACTAVIARHPFRFVHLTNFGDRQELGKSTKYLIASIVVTYLILIPSLIRHDKDLSQGFFIVFQYLRMCVIFLCLHVMLRAMRSRASIRVTITAQSYVNGFFIPLGTVLYLPFILEVGPDVLLGGFATKPALSLPAEAALTRPVVQVSFIAFIFFNIWGIIVVTVWYSRAHSIDVVRTLIGLFVGTGIGFAVYEFLFLPTWEQIADIFRTLLRFT